MAAEYRPDTLRGTALCNLQTAGPHAVARQDARRMDRGQPEIDETKKRKTANNRLYSVSFCSLAMTTAALS